ncbi:dentin matrix acidic phosphoprotein 1-like [Myiozetetes cayanensis]|uniref:dentin matrix acidic phosphoprotein 1-like n=1 Tax=Myiozetetes cayanensis TaxID=478635 RepID=UPI00215E0A01|nr:dentin matrix acidic phosphoprotein 1-like [Myiozetetes cayanensis]
MRVAVFLVLLLWAVASAHPVPGRESTRSSTQQEDTTNEEHVNKLGNLLDGGVGRHPPVGVERGDNALAGDLMGGNAVDEELGEHSGRDNGDHLGQAQHVNQVDHEAASARNGNNLGFLEGDARDADDGDNGDHYGTGANGLPSHAGGFLDEEDDSGDDTFDGNREEERGEGPTYVAGADGAGEPDGDAGRGDAGAGRGHGDSSSSSSSESAGADYRRYRSYVGSWYERNYRQGGASSSSQEEESYDFEDEAMQGDDPSAFDSWGSSYKVRRAGHRALGNSRESVQGDGSHHWEEGDSRSPEVEDADSGEDSPSVEDNSQSEEPVDSQSEEKSSSRSREDGDGEDSPSREDEDSSSREGTDDQSEEELQEFPDVVSTLNEHSNSQTWEGQEDWESAEDRSVPSMPDSESGEEEGDQSKSREDDEDQSQSTEDTVEESREDENDSDSVPSTSGESQSASPEDDSSPEDNTGEDSRSPESDNSESQEDDDDEESHSQEDATRESSSHGDDSSLQSLESGSRKRRLGALRHKPAADYDDNDCQDGY